MNFEDLGIAAILSNVQPPRRQALTHLAWTAKILAAPAGDREALVRAFDFFEPGVGAAGQLLATAKPGSLTTGRPQQFQATPEQNAELDKLSKNSDVVEMLAASAFWAATQVTGTPWTPTDGLQESTVSLVFTSGGQSQRWQHSLPAITFADYRVAAQVVPVKVRTRDQANDVRIKGCAAFPQYGLAFALDLHAPGKPVVNTCMLLDIVPAIVAVAVQRLKQCLMVPRPNDPSFGAGPYDTVIPMPQFSAVPGGHAAVLYALARVLSAVTGASLNELENLAEALAEDREAAGLHTSFDTQLGRDLGRAFGQWLVDAVDHPDAFGAWSAAFINAANEW